MDGEQFVKWMKGIWPYTTSAFPHCALASWIELNTGDLSLGL